VALVFIIPALLYGLQKAVSGPDGFQSMVGLFGERPIRFALSLILVSFVHHFLAGARHLLLDIHIGMDRGVARLSGWLVLGAVLLAALLLARWIFL